MCCHSEPQPTTFPNCPCLYDQRHQQPSPDYDHGTYVHHQYDLTYFQFSDETILLAFYVIVFLPKVFAFLPQLFP